MKKNLLVLAAGVFFLSGYLNAQLNKDEQPLKERQLSLKVFKTKNPTEDKTDLLQITGLGTESYSASNIADGTANSYNHTLKITLPLLVSDRKNGEYQLVFYAESDKIPYAVEQSGTITNIYYPVVTYNGLVEKLEKSIAARKKIQLKIVQGSNGYREASLIF